MQYYVTRSILYSTFIDDLLIASHMNDFDRHYVAC